jgi:K+-transporting ATPase A subunit
MTASTVTLLVVFLALVLLCVKPLGLYMARVMNGEPIWPLWSMHCSVYSSGCP